MATEGPKLPNGLIKTLIPIAGILALVIVGLLVVKSRVAKETASSATAVDLHEGSVLPDFPLRKFPNGEELNASSIDAKVMLVNFWATWCEACVSEMPSIVKLRSSFRNQGFEVVAVNMDENPTAVMPKALKTFKIDFPVYMDSDSKLSEIFDVRAIPLSVVMDRNRKVLFVEAGGLDWSSDEIQKMMRSWLQLTQG